MSSITINSFCHLILAIHESRERQPNSLSHLFLYSTPDTLHVHPQRLVYHQYVCTPHLMLPRQLLLHHLIYLPMFLNQELPFSVWNVSKYGVFSGPYFTAFGLNMERYFVSLRIQPECGKIQTRKYSVFGHFSRSDVNSNFSTVNRKTLHDYLFVYKLFSLA